MNPAAVALVLGAALAHATWNLLAKRAKDPQGFLWAATIVAAIALLPIGAWGTLRYPPPLSGWGVLAVSVALEVGYFRALGQGYRSGDLSMVYPVARGVSPLLASTLGVLLLGERLSSQAAAGIAVIVAGMLIAHLRTLTPGAVRPLVRALAGPATRYAVLAGICTGSYTTVDKVGVGIVWPPLYEFLLYLGTALGLAALAGLRGSRLREVRAACRDNPGSVIAAGLLGPLAYGLVLLALSLAPVAYIAPAREVSVAVGVLLGTFVLREPLALPRFTGACLIMVGLFLLATG